MLEAVDTRVDACRSALDAEIQSRASLQQLQSVQEEVDRRSKNMKRRVQRMRGRHPSPPTYDDYRPPLTSTTQP